MFSNMPENVQSAMFEILKRIQSDVADVKTRMGSVETRLDSVEREVKAVRRELAGTLVLMRGTVADFDGRMNAAEADIRLVTEHLGL